MYLFLCLGGGAVLVVTGAILPSTSRPVPPSLALAFMRCLPIRSAMRFALPGNDADYAICTTVSQTKPTHVIGLVV